MTIEVAPECELVVPEAAGELGTWLPPHEPLLVARLAGAPSEGQGAFHERSRYSVA